MLEIKEIKFLKNYKDLNKLSIKIYEIFLEFASLEFENDNIRFKLEVIQDSFLDIQDRIEQIIEYLKNNKDNKNTLNKRLNILTIDDILMF